MGNYAWPATLANDGQRWVATLVDWPHLAASDPMPQLAVPKASQVLSGGVRERLRANGQVPVPSNSKPEHVLIPVDADASARLDEYVESQQDRQLQRLNEFEKANQSKRQAFLSDYQHNVGPAESRSSQADDASVQFALSGIKTTFLLNGGALVAIPAALELSSSVTLGSWPLPASASMFFVGLFFAALTNYLAFRSVWHASLAQLAEAGVRNIDITLAYYPVEDASKQQTERATLVKNRDDKFKKAQSRANLGLACYALSIASFLGGVGTVLGALAGLIG